MTKIEDMVRIGKRVKTELQRGQVDPLPEGFELKSEYKIECPYCSATLSMEPSIMMQMGMNIGGGQCLKCQKHFHIRINLADNTAFTACFEVPGV